MESFGSTLFGIIASVWLCVVGMSVTAKIFDQPREQLAEQVDDVTALWTSAPTRIDVSKQLLARLPPAPQQNIAMADKSITSEATHQDNAEVQTAALQPGILSADHLSWCQARYRSFDDATNTYRSFSGEMRECFAPGDDSTVAVSNDNVARVSSDADGDISSSLCSKRYTSYRPSDGTYQPFGSGPRRKCVIDQVADNR